MNINDIFVHRSEMDKLMNLCGGNPIPANSLISFRINYVDTRTQTATPYIKGSGEKPPPGTKPQCRELMLEDEK